MPIWADRAAWTQPAGCTGSLTVCNEPGGGGGQEDAGDEGECGSSGKRIKGDYSRAPRSYSGKRGDNGELTRTRRQADNPGFASGASRAGGLMLMTFYLCWENVSRGKRQLRELVIVKIKSVLALTEKAVDQPQGVKLPISCDRRKSIRDSCQPMSSITVLKWSQTNNMPVPGWIPPFIFTPNCSAISLNSRSVTAADKPQYFFWDLKISLREMGMCTHPKTQCWRNMTDGLLRVHISDTFFFLFVSTVISKRRGDKKLTKRLLVAPPPIHIRSLCTVDTTVGKPRPLQRDLIWRSTQTCMCTCVFRPYRWICRKEQISVHHASVN